MLNWNEVTVGETEIVNRNVGRRFLVVGRHDDFVWLYDREHREYHWQSIGGLDLWTIHDPWEEITEECEWVKCEDTFASWYIAYKGKQTICHDSKYYKTDGRRVWKRKEGV